MVVVSLLMVALASILSSVWRGLCLPTLDASARCRIALEANLATAALARDFGGSLAEPAAQVGGKTDGRLVARDTPAPDHLRLCFHGGGSADLTPTWAAPDTVVSYRLQGDHLVRVDETADKAVTVAGSVTAFRVAPLADGTGVSITLSFAARDLALTYQLQALDPPPP